MRTALHASAGSAEISPPDPFFHSAAQKHSSPQASPREFRRDSTIPDLTPNLFHAGDTSEEISRMLDGLQRDKIRPIVVASHPRCGTHLLIDSLRVNFAACRSWKFIGERQDRLYLNLDHLALLKKPLRPATAAKILRRVDRPLVKTHAWPDFRQVLLEDRTRNFSPYLLRWFEEHATFLYIYRDGRDAMTSLHFFMQDFDPTARVPIGQFMRQKVNGISRPRIWARHVRSWCANPQVYFIAMEELIKQTVQTVRTLAQHLNLPVESDPVLPARTRNFLHSRFNRVFRACPQSTAILSAGSSRSGEWRKLFTEDDRKFFVDETDGLLTTLAFEDSDDWVTDPTPPSKKR